MIDEKIYSREWLENTLTTYLGSLDYGKERREWDNRGNASLLLGWLFLYLKDNVWNMSQERFKEVEYYADNWYASLDEIKKSLKGVREERFTIVKPYFSGDAPERIGQKIMIALNLSVKKKEEAERKDYLSGEFATEMESGPLSYKIMDYALNHSGLPEPTLVSNRRNKKMMENKPNKNDNGQNVSPNPPSPTSPEEKFISKSDSRRYDLDDGWDFSFFTKKVDSKEKENSSFSAASSSVLSYPSPRSSYPSSSSYSSYPSSPSHLNYLPLKPTLASFEEPKQQQDEEKKDPICKPVSPYLIETKETEKTAEENERDAPPPFFSQSNSLKLITEDINRIFGTGRNIVPNG
ncbi:MAG: hypothetical protein LBB09_03735 [Rickettsiales bacterium]|nr:hypothetical protein [Rickettsiales bacterium]